MTLRATLRLACLALALLAAGLLAGSQAYSITDEEIFRDFRFNFINPGARSLALGGAFVAIADDSTAALANPAGLVWLRKPELFEEFRVQAVADTETTDTLPMTSAGVAGDISSGTSPKNAFSPSFFSYVYPRSKWAVGISRQELLNVDNRTNSTFNLNLFGAAVTFEGSGTIDTRISNWNVSGAFKITDNLSVGGSLVYSILKMDSGVNNTLLDPNGFFVDDGDPNTPCLVCNTPLGFYTTRIHDMDSDLRYNLGVLWNIGKKVTVAGSYRKGARYLVHNQIAQTFSTAAPFFNPDISDPNVIGPSAEITFDVPDSYSVGVAYRPIDRLTLSLEGTRIEYSDLMHGFTSGLNILTYKDCNQPQCSPGSNDIGARFEVEDRTEAHFGGEYVFTVGTNPLAVRVGYYNDPDNRVRANFGKHTLDTFTGFVFAVPNGESTLSRNESFPGRYTEHHVTAGAGMVIQERFQIDVAVDFSDIADQYVLSSIYRF